MDPQMGYNVWHFASFTYIKVLNVRKISVLIGEDDGRTMVYKKALDSRHTEKYSLIFVFFFALIVYNEKRENEVKTATIGNLDFSQIISGTYLTHSPWILCVLSTNNQVCKLSEQADSTPHTTAAAITLSASQLRYPCKAVL